MGGATMDVSSGPSGVSRRGTMVLRSSTLWLLGSTSSLSGAGRVLRSRCSDRSCDVQVGHVTNHNNSRHPRLRELPVAVLLGWMLCLLQQT